MRTRFPYAQVLRALHVNVLHIGPNGWCRSPQDMELLWVRWLGVEPQYSWGFQEAWLPKVGFVPEGDYNAFGFLHPSFIIHGCHLIPSFSDGRTTALLRQGASVARHPTDDDRCSLYINMCVALYPLLSKWLDYQTRFADRDMFCRFSAIGVGHEV
ncbi:hypothetical protein EV401DRAFT_1863153 [Pisolithus croceorrhizus]|nr:hypothetical protein EV401DRAFT_1863153 [Pisolithus croceorrhizus]